MTAWRVEVRTRSTARDWSIWTWQIEIHSTFQLALNAATFYISGGEPIRVERDIGWSREAKVAEFILTLVTKQ